MNITTLLDTVRELSPEPLLIRRGLENIHEMDFRLFEWGFGPGHRPFICIKITLPDGTRLAKTFFQRYIGSNVWMDASCCGMGWKWIWYGGYKLFAGDPKTEPLLTGAIYDLITKGSVVLTDEMDLNNKYARPGDEVKLGWE